MHLGIQQVTRMNVDVMSRLMVNMRDLLVGMVLDNEDGLQLLLWVLLSLIQVDILRLCPRPTPASAQCNMPHNEPNASIVNSN